MKEIEMTTRYSPQVNAMATAIMLARIDGGCVVEDWEIEARDNPHVKQAIDQATAALRALAACPPSEGMVNVGASVAVYDVGDEYGELSHSATEAIYTAMLGALVKEIGG